MSFNIFTIFTTKITNLIKTFLRVTEYLTMINLIQFSSKAISILPAETAHNFSLYLLSKPSIYKKINHRYITKYDLSCEISGLGKLYHPIGLAAGYDKNATSLSGLCKLDFSFIEVGTITVMAQTGNPKPRVFRLRQTNELINKMGFPNNGMLNCKNNISKHYMHQNTALGLNIGKNKNTSIDNAIDDYISLIDELKSCGDYFVINISSPNTPQLRKLANPVFIKTLEERISEINPQLVKKTWIKLDPDLSIDQFIELIETLCITNFAGVILTNTHKVNYPFQGGLSGHSLRALAMEKLSIAKQIHQGNLQIISVGGVFSGLDVFNALEKGACAVQVYTALVYRGPWVVSKILQELEWELQLRDMTSLSDIRLI